MKAIWNLGKLILAVFLFGQAVYLAGQAGAASDIMTVFIERSDLTAECAQEICDSEAGQEEPASLCIWRETKDISIACRETGQNVSLSGVTAIGNTELLIPGSGILSWRQKGCLLDTVSAEELFGTSKAAGQMVWYQDQAYTVCGTFASLQKLLIRRAEKQDRENLNRISLRFTAKSSQKDALNQFLMRYGISGKGTELQTLSILVADLCLLFPGMAAFLLLRNFTKQKSKKAAAAAVILAGFLSVIFWRLIRIPPEMIPSRWSDFSFWIKWWEEQKSQILLLSGSALGENQMAVLSLLLRSFFCSAFSTILLSGCRISD